jgi:hypothetical protein
MDDPRNLPRPEDLFKKIQTLAIDLAYGVKVDDWSPLFQISRDSQGREHWTNLGYITQNGKLQEYLTRKWEQDRVHPQASYIEVFEYLRRVSEDIAVLPREGVHPVLGGGKAPSVTYILTPKAMKLLEEPLIPPSVFIAYGRQQSSAFALLIESKLHERGAKAFLDRQIKGGEKWEALIKSTIQNQVNYFVCLIAPSTLQSPNVRNEIHWAVETENVWPIPIWHQDFRPEDELSNYDDLIRDFVRSNHAIQVKVESAEDYDTALSKLLNQLRFASADEMLFA